jgi:hypothetical protein
MLYIVAVEYIYPYNSLKNCDLNNFDNFAKNKFSYHIVSRKLNIKLN